MSMRDYYRRLYIRAGLRVLQVREYPARLIASANSFIGQGMVPVLVYGFNPHGPHGVLRRLTAHGHGIGDQVFGLDATEVHRLAAAADADGDKDEAVWLRRDRPRVLVYIDDDRYWRVPPRDGWDDD